MVISELKKNAFSVVQPLLQELQLLNIVVILALKIAFKVRKRQEKIDKATQTVKEDDFSPTIKDKEFLSIKESSLLLGVSRWTIYRLIEKELLNSKKIGRRVIITIQIG